MKEIYDKLRDDEHYYGDFGKQFLSNSDISTLLKNPKDLHKPKPSSPALLVGGYFHTAILEPDKLNRFKIVEANTRNTKAYKEISEGERKFKALSISTNNAGMPCGACRQVIWDICGNIPVLICDDNSIITKTESIKLLPMPFDATKLS